MITKVRAWHVNKKTMFSCSEMVEDQMVLLTDGRFINVRCADSIMRGVYKREEMIPLFFSGATDINDRDIYEGDVLWCEEENCKGDVWFYDCQFVSDCTGVVKGLKNGDPVEIIGNIYENPELYEYIVRI